MNWTMLGELRDRLYTWMAARRHAGNPHKHPTKRKPRKGDQLRDRHPHHDT